MEINNIFNKLNQTINNCIELDFNNTNISNFIKELSERIEKMQDILVVDRIEGEYAVCENRTTKKMTDINLQDLPKEIKPGTVLKFNNGKYQIDTESQKEIENRIKQKMNNLWTE